MKKTIAAFFSPVMTAQAKMPEEAAKAAATEAVAAVAGAGSMSAEHVFDEATQQDGTLIRATKGNKGREETYQAFVAADGELVRLKATVFRNYKSQMRPEVSVSSEILLSKDNYTSTHADHSPLPHYATGRSTGGHLYALHKAFQSRIDDYNMANIEAAAHEAMKANLPAGALSWTIYDETKPTTLFARSCNPDLSCTQLATELKVDPETRVMSAAVTASHTGPLLSPTMPRETHATTVTMADVRGPVGDTQTTTDRAIRHCADADIHEDLGDKAKATLNDFLLAKRGVIVRTETAPNPVQHVLTDNQRMAKRMAEYMLVIEAQADKSPAQYGPVNLRPDSNSHKAPNRAYRFE